MKIPKKTDDQFDEIATNAIARLTAAAAGFALLGPTGSVIAVAAESVVEDVAKRFLSRREVGRMEKVINYAVEAFSQKIKQGSKPKKGFNKEKYKELFEGTLLKSRESYEEKKLPLLGNLFAVAPFTNTPIENINQSLIYAEQLSYRQLCIIAVIGINEWQGSLKLADKPLMKQDEKNKFDEKITGVYADINHLLVLGLIGQVFSEDAGPAISSGMFLITPANLKLLYPGRLLNNGMLLGTIDRKDLDEVTKILQKT